MHCSRATAYGYIVLLERGAALPAFHPTGIVTRPNGGREAHASQLEHASLRVVRLGVATCRRARYIPPRSHTCLICHSYAVFPSFTNPDIKESTILYTNSPILGIFAPVDSTGIESVADNAIHAAGIISSASHRFRRRIKAPLQSLNLRNMRILMADAKKSECQSRRGTSIVIRSGCAKSQADETHRHRGPRQEPRRGCVHRVEVQGRGENRMRMLPLAALTPTSSVFDALTTDNARLISSHARRELIDRVQHHQPKGPELVVATPRMASWRLRSASIQIWPGEQKPRDAPGPRQA